MRIDKVSSLDGQVFEAFFIQDQRHFRRGVPIVFQRAGCCLRSIAHGLHHVFLMKSGVARHGHEPETGALGGQGMAKITQDGSYRFMLIGHAAKFGPRPKVSPQVLLPPDHLVMQSRAGGESIDIHSRFGSPAMDIVDGRSQDIDRVERKDPAQIFESSPLQGRTLAGE